MKNCQNLPRICKNYSLTETRRVSEIYYSYWQLFIKEAGKMVKMVFY